MKSALLFALFLLSAMRASAETSAAPQKEIQLKDFSGTITIQEERKVKDLTAQVGGSLGLISVEDSAKRIEGNNIQSFFVELEKSERFIARMERTLYSIETSAGNLSVKKNSDLISFSGIYKKETHWNIENVSLLFGFGFYRKWVQFNTTVGTSSVLDATEPVFGIMPIFGLRKSFEINTTKSIELGLLAKFLGDLPELKNPAVSGVLEVGFRF